jgi:hypothetical protein
MTPTEQDVLDAFDSFGDQFVQGMALQASLRSKGFDITKIVVVINQLIEQNILRLGQTGSISRP